MQEDLYQPQRTFILGLGAQKSGTTWLYEYLINSKKVAVGIVKEFHVWDALTVPEFNNFCVSGDKKNEIQTEELKIRAMMQQRPEFYFEYFVTLMSSQNCRMAMDITPTYAALGQKVLKYIKEQFKSLGIRVKVIFLMRDPIERCWSAARMENNYKYGNTLVNSSELRVYARNKRFKARSQYHKTLQTIFSVFDEENTYIGFYENMFKEQNLRELSKFCDVECNLDFATKRVFPSRKLEDIDEFTQSWIAHDNRDIYYEIKRLFPGIEDVWDGFKYLPIK